MGSSRSKTSFFDRRAAQWDEDAHAAGKEARLGRIVRGWRLKPGGRLFILNLQGSRGLNRFHRRCAAAVAHDRMPGAGKLKRLLEHCGYTRVSVTDRADLYLARARG